MRLCIACCLPLKGSPGQQLHEHCVMGRPLIPRLPKPYKARRVRRESMGKRIARVAMELAGEERWEAADGKRRNQWKREAKLLIFSQLQPHV